MAHYFVKTNFILTGDDHKKLLWLMERTGHISKSTYMRYLLRKEFARETAGGERMEINESSIPTS